MALSVSAGSILVRPADCIHADRFSNAPAACLNLFPRHDWLIANGFGDMSEPAIERGLATIADLL